MIGTIKSILVLLVVVTLVGACSPALPGFGPAVYFLMSLLFFLAGLFPANPALPGETAAATSSVNSFSCDWRRFFFEEEAPDFCDVEVWPDFCEVKPFELAPLSQKGQAARRQAEWACQAQLLEKSALLYLREGYPVAARIAKTAAIDKRAKSFGLMPMSRDVARIIGAF